MYGLRFGYSGYFFGGTGRILGKFNDFVFGKFNDESFACRSKSGGQNLWLPFREDLGLKVFHPERYSGTLEKAKAHFEAQKVLAEQNLAPKPFELCELEVSFVDCGFDTVLQRCYGMLMERVVNGGVGQVAVDLQRLFGVHMYAHVTQNPRATWHAVDSFVEWYGPDALTLADYTIFCRFFGVSEKPGLKKIIDDLKGRMPPGLQNAPDLLSPSNVVLDSKGNAKVVDCDLSGL